MFTKKELDVLFHVMNNSWGDCFAVAQERAADIDAISEDDFNLTYCHLIGKLANMGADK